VRDYAKNGQTRRLKLDGAVVELVWGYVAEHCIGETEVMFPAELVVPPRRPPPAAQGPRPRRDHQPARGLKIKTAADQAPQPKVPRTVKPCPHLVTDSPGQCAQARHRPAWPTRCTSAGSACAGTRSSSQHGRENDVAEASCCVASPPDLVSGACDETSVGPVRRRGNSCSWLRTRATWREIDRWLR
jgi:hypothetical protein